MAQPCLLLLVIVKKQHKDLTIIIYATWHSALTYLRDLTARRKVIIANIEQQGKLTPSLATELNNADNKTRLEDLYLPFKPKRKTKGQIAIAAGLAPLANSIYNNWQLNPEQEAVAFINKEQGFTDEKLVLEGAHFILVERFAEDANLIQKLRRHLLKQAHLCSKVMKGKTSEASKYRDYFEHSELLRNVPSHRMLAMLRGRNDGLLSLRIDAVPGQEGEFSSAQQLITEHFNLRLTGQAAATFLTKVVSSTWKIKLSQSLETELLGTLREQAEVEAIKVFSRNLNDLLYGSARWRKNNIRLRSWYANRL